MNDEEMDFGHMNGVEMSDLSNDGTLRDVVATLSVLPLVTERDIQAIVARAAGDARPEHGSGPGSAHPAVAGGGGPARVIPLRPARPRWFTSVPLAAAAGLVLVAGIGGFVLSDVIAGRSTAAAPGSVATDAAPPRDGVVPVSTAAADRGAEAPIVTQFVLDSPWARQVSLVGAFNGWDADATPLVRDPATGLWVVSLPLAPGRHVYAFMVDGGELTLDPRAPTTSDPDLGTSGSVILVGTP